MTKARPKPVSDQIRGLIDRCGLTRYQICKQTGLDQSALSRFMSGERGLSTEVLDTLGELLGFEVSMRGPARPLSEHNKKEAAGVHSVRRSAGYSNKKKGAADSGQK